MPTRRCWRQVDCRRPVGASSLRGNFSGAASSTDRSRCFARMLMPHGLLLNQRPGLRLTLFEAAVCGVGCLSTPIACGRGSGLEYARCDCAGAQAQAVTPALTTAILSAAMNSVLVLPLAEVLLALLWTAMPAAMPPDPTTPLAMIQVLVA